MTPSNPTYDCPICDQVCPSLAQYLSHYERAHGRGGAAAAEGATVPAAECGMNGKDEDEI